ncbi:MAG: carboxypeptidase-like regulatory domain-containing protein [Candidatus Thermoplasmatota archaeon]
MALIAGSLLLAGCSSPADTDPADDDALGLVATATTGILRGVVVDDAIRPLANATVAARGPTGEERTTVTAADGLFGFEGLAPGTWFVTGRKLADEDSQGNIEVEAGVDNPPVVKLLLVFVPGEAPFVTELKVEAFVQCIVPGANLCAIANLYPCALAGYCAPIVDDTSFVQLYDSLVALQRTPDWFQLEVVWDSTQSISPDLAILGSAHSPDDGAGRDERQAAVNGPSPLLWTLNQTLAKEWELGTAEGVGYEIFGHTEAASPIGSAGFVLSQRVDFFFHVFYGYMPPEGWQFSVDGVVPQPPR